MSNIKAIRSQQEFFLFIFMIRRYTKQITSTRWLVLRYYDEANQDLYIANSGSSASTVMK
jgi:hypothetical protein